MFRSGVFSPTAGAVVTDMSAVGQMWVVEAKPAGWGYPGWGAALAQLPNLYMTTSIFS